MNKIKELRKQNNLTQTDLAKFMSTTASNISGWELDKWQPSNDDLIKLANYFNVSIEYLLSSKNLLTAEDNANGEMDTKKISMTTDQKDIFDKTNEVLEVLGYKGKELIIVFCDTLIANFK